MNSVKILLLFLMVNSFSGIAQEKKNDWSLVYSVGLSDLRINMDRVIPIENEERPILTHSIGLQMRYFFTEKVGLLTGIGYEQFGEIEKFNGLSVYDQITGSFIGSDVQFNRTYEFISSPVLLNYTPLNREKYKFDIQVGPVLNYFMNLRTISEIFNSTGGKEKRTQNFQSDDIKNFHISGLIGFSYERSLTEKVFFKVGPQFSYFFTSVSQWKEPGIFPYRLALNLGIGF